MSSEQDATLDAGEDPNEGTLDALDQDTDDGDQGTVDWERRYRELQSFSDRRLADLEKRLSAFEDSPDVDVEEDEEDEEELDLEEEPSDDDGVTRLERDSWRLAEQEYGRDAIVAYDRAARLLDRASTPADFMAAFEGYHRARQEAELKSYSKTAAQEPAPVQTDANRPDASPRNNANPEAEAALAKGDSLGWLRAQVRAVRGE